MKKTIVLMFVTAFSRQLMRSQNLASGVSPQDLHGARASRRLCLGVCRYLLSALRIRSRMIKMLQELRLGI